MFVSLDIPNQPMNYFFNSLRSYVGSIKHSRVDSVDFSPETMFSFRPPPSPMSRPPPDARMKRVQSFRVMYHRWTREPRCGLDPHDGVQDEPCMNLRITRDLHVSCQSQLETYLEMEDPRETCKISPRVISADGALVTGSY